MSQVNTKSFTLLAIAVILAVTLPIVNYVFAQTQTGSNATVSNSQSQIEQLNKTMAKLESSDDPKDIATLAYIWGFPLISQVRLGHPVYGQSMASKMNKHLRLPK